MLGGFGPVIHGAVGHLGPPFPICGQLWKGLWSQLGLEDSAGQARWPFLLTAWMRPPGACSGVCIDAQRGWLPGAL